MFPFLFWLARGMPSLQTPATTAAPVPQRPTYPPSQFQTPKPAFPDSPRMPPPRVKDLSVPSPPTTPGPIQEQDLNSNVPLTVNEAVQIALHLQPSLGNSVGALLIQQGQTREIGAAEHLQVPLGVGLNKITTLSPAPPGAILSDPDNILAPGASAASTYLLSAGLKQLIFDFNMTRNLVRQSEALERSDQLNVTVARENLVQAVENAFYNYTEATRLVEVNNANLINRQRQLDLARAMLNNGVGEPSDLATAQTSKSQAVVQLNQARNNAEQDRILLLQQMGVDPLTPIVAANESAPGPTSLDARALTEQALAMRPEVKSAGASLKAAGYGLRAAKAVNLPAIYAEGGLGFSGDNSPTNLSTASISAGFSVPIVDGGYRNGAVRIAHGQITTAEANLKTVMLQVRTDVSSAYMALLSAEQRVVAADNEVYNAREDVRIAEGRYAAGAGLFLDITTAQGLLVSAMSDQEAARNALDLARVQIHYATGDLATSLPTAAYTGR